MKNIMDPFGELLCVGKDTIHIPDMLGELAQAGTEKLNTFINRFKESITEHHVVGAIATLRFLYVAEEDRPEPSREMLDKLNVGIARLQTLQKEMSMKR